MVTTTYRIIQKYKKEHMEEEEKAEEKPEEKLEEKLAEILAVSNRVTGTIVSVNPDKFNAGSFYADIDGDDGVKYKLTGTYYRELADAANIVKKDSRISFVPKPQRKNINVSDVVKI